MFKHNRPKIHFLPLTLDGSPTPTAVDTKIYHKDKLSVAIEATKKKLQTSKEMPTPNLQQMLKQTT